MLCIKHALIRQVVHGKHRFRRTSARGQIRRRQASMPVVRMHHVRAPEWIKPTGHFTSYPSQQRKTQYVIGVGKQVRIVIRTPRTIVKMRGINQVNPHTVVMTKQQTNPARECVATADYLRIRDAPTNVGKRGQQNAGINTIRDLRRRQRANHICQTTCFQQGKHLRTYM